MTVDDFLKALFGVILAAVAGVLGWVMSKVFKNSDESLLHGAKVKEIESKVEKLEKSQLTIEGVRDIVEKAFDKRDDDHMEFKLYRDANEKRIDALHDAQIELVRELAKAVKNAPQ